MSELPEPVPVSAAQVISSYVSVISDPSSGEDICPGILLTRAPSLLTTENRLGPSELVAETRTYIS